MRSSAGTRAARAVTTAMIVLTLVLTGCAAHPSPTARSESASATPVPEHTLIAGVGDDIVLINCAVSVPLESAAGVLGVTVAQVIDQQYPPAVVTPYAGVVAAEMADQAVRAAGGHQCRYVLADGEYGGPEVFVSVVPDAVGAFGRIEPDVNDGLRNLAPAELGDEAFSACRDGEWQGCRAEVLTGTTWVSISVGTPDLDPALFQEYAAGVVESLGALTFAQSDAPARADCAALLSPDELAGAGAMVDATVSDWLVLDERSSQSAAARVRGGLVDCAWTGTGAGADAASSGVALTILPGAEGRWGYRPPAEMASPIVLAPVDLAGEADAAWPAAGVESLGGCAADQCQVTLLADGVWLTLTTTGPAGLAGTTALATAAYARYIQSV
jgi:hypothetical protein